MVKITGMNEKRMLNAPPTAMITATSQSGAPQMEPSHPGRFWKIAAPQRGGMREEGRGMREEG